jgi:hypothetical protein
MFKTIVVVCFLQVPDLCLQFEDTTGLKPTTEACTERAMEMVRGIMTVPANIPPPYHIAHRCVQGDNT